MDLKKPLSFEEQIDKLVTHGIIISDREKITKKGLRLKRCIIFIKWMKYCVIHFDDILKKQRYIIGHK